MSTWERFPFLLFTSYNIYQRDATLGYKKNVSKSYKNLSPHPNATFLLYHIILGIGLSLRTLREGTQLLIPSQTLCWIPFAIQLAIMQMRCSKAEAAVYDC